MNNNRSSAKNHYAPTLVTASLLLALASSVAAQNNPSPSSNAKNLQAVIVTGTRARYVEAFERLTEIAFDDYLANPSVVLP